MIENLTSTKRAGRTAQLDTANCTLVIRQGGHVIAEQTVTRDMDVQSATARMDAESVGYAVQALIEDETVAKFDALLKLESEVQGEMASVAFAPRGLPDYLVVGQKRALKRARASLSAAVDTLTRDEMVAYGAYRIEARKG